MTALIDVTVATARALVEHRAETASRSLAELLVQRFQSLAPAERLDFYDVLLKSFGADRAKLEAAIKKYQSSPSEATIADLSDAAESDRLRLFRSIHLAQGGISVLLSMRCQILETLVTNSHLAPVERDLKHLMRSWFNRGFLHLRQLDWTTPAHVLESLIRYEAVHEIRGWQDLRRRLAPDRRCFGFFHPTLPDEPVIFVEVALVTGTSRSIQSLLDAPPSDDSGWDTAVFYSITNCQDGLRGISFGNFLIKQVTERLRAEISGLDHFVTLSPIPGFARWLDEQRPNVDPTDKEMATRHCAEYLVTARRGGMPADPVARFHLRNGARVEQVNWEGDVSPKGLAQSHGVLVNYRYSDLDLVANYDALVLDGVVTVSAEVAALVDSIELEPEQRNLYRH